MTVATATHVPLRVRHVELCGGYHLALANLIEQGDIVEIEGREARQTKKKGTIEELITKVFHYLELYNMVPDS